MRSREFGFYARITLKTVKEIKKYNEMLCFSKLISHPSTSSAGHSVALFDDVFELEKYIKEYTEMLIAESR